MRLLDSLCAVLRRSKFIIWHVSLSSSKRYFRRAAGAPVSHVDIDPLNKGLKHEVANALAVEVVRLQECCFTLNWLTLRVEHNSLSPITSTPSAWPTLALLSTGFWLCWKLGIGWTSSAIPVKGNRNECGCCACGSRQGFVQASCKLTQIY